MCLLVLAWQAHPRYHLIVAANRDEYHDRAAAALAPWPDAPHLIAGRDQRAGGTWLGMDRQRRFGIITNFRDLQRPRPDGPSRGALIPGYLSQGAGAEAYLKTLAPTASGYSGFNLLLADGDSLWYATNRSEPFARLLQPGVHGLSNHSLDTPWPKLLRVRQRFEEWLRASSSLAAGELFDMLNDREPAPDDASIPVGLTPELARALSAPFVLNPVYGTRCSTVLMLEASGAMNLIERRFDASGRLSGETIFELSAAEWP